MDTTAGQETAVAQGLALGVLDAGVTMITAQKLIVESAFRHAWRQWPHAAQFPVINRRHDDIIRIMRKSSNRRGPLVAAWDMDRWITPYRMMEASTNEEAGELLERFYAPPWSAWRNLAQTFVGQFKDVDLTRESQQ